MGVLYIPGRRSQPNDLEYLFAVNLTSLCSLKNSASASVFTGLKEWSQVMDMTLCECEPKARNLCEEQHRLSSQKDD
jgi:hypothetical protein